MNTINLSLLKLHSNFILGYYRVNYDKENWRLIQQQLMMDHTIIPPINRAQIIDDSMNLHRRFHEFSSKWFTWLRHRA